MARRFRVPVLQIGHDAGKSPTPALADAHLRKPFSADDLVACVRHVLDER
jgi:hypothetical protein